MLEETLVEGTPLVRLRLARRIAGQVLHHASAYRFGSLLIDTGPPATARELLAWCRGPRGAGIERVVLTHHHEDHVGGAPRLAHELGLPLFAPALSLPRLARRVAVPPYRRLVWGAPEPCSAHPLTDDVQWELGRLEVIAAPGHAFDHVVLWDPERRWLFSGDLFVHERVRYLRRVERLHEHLRSLRRALALGPELLVCSHAGPIRDAQGALARKIAFWENLGEQAHALAARGQRLGAITRALLGREGLFNYLSCGDFSKRNLARALLGTE